MHDATDFRVSSREFRAAQNGEMSMGRERRSQAGETIARMRETPSLVLAALLVLSLSMGSSAHAIEDPFRPLLDALYQHESVNGTEPVGDEGRSHGPYHIGRDYWTDGLTQLRREGFDYIADALADYKANVHGRWASEVIMKAVWRRYEPEAYSSAEASAKADRLRSFEICARLHNGSRRWREKPATAEYWEIVKGLIQN